SYAPPAPAIPSRRKVESRWRAPSPTTTGPEPGESRRISSTPTGAPNWRPLRKDGATSASNRPISPAPSPRSWPARRSEDETARTRLRRAGERRRGAGAPPPPSHRGGLLGRLLHRALGPSHPSAGGLAISRLGDFDRSGRPGSRDRKSTRLNSSHVKSSYAVFCL